jgi:hypothetical protein
VASKWLSGVRKTAEAVIPVGKDNKKSSWSWSWLVTTY